MAEDYTSMTVAELKVLLKEQGLPVSGKKSELIERLSGANSEVPEAEDVEAPAADEAVDTAAMDIFRAKRPPIPRALLAIPPLLP